MKLKSLEISGFKSFADDTKIEFEDGVTGIVGPNGSGKSNISEAIRWVLGEQSAKNLRGSRMPDVIFNGSTKRKPLNRARVTMILDNSDHYLKTEYTEINVTRKLFRNGESNYQLNGQDCRLKDILNLFMDSGIGDNAFSMISQGRVESIFNSKPEDRRFIVEELIGVSKYRLGKEKAKRELDQTAGYLDRVNDLMTELSSQIEPLAQQSSLAKEYVAQKKQFDTLDQSRIVLEIESLQSDLKTQQAQLKEKQSRVADTKQQLANNAAQLDEARDTTNQLSSKKDDTNQQLLDVTSRKQQVVGARALDSERQKHQQETLGELSNRIKASQENLKQAQATLTTTQSQLTELKAALKQDRAKAKQLKLQLADLDEAKLADEEDQLQNNYIDQLQAITTLHNQKQYLEKNQQRATSESQQADQRLHSLQTDLKEQQKQLEVANQKLQSQQQQYDELQEKCQKLAAAHEQRQQQIAQLNNQWLSALEVSQQAKARLKSLQELAQNYAGFYQGTKAVLKAKDQLSGIIGPVAEILQVPEKYTKAVEAAIGAQQQHVVVSDESAGKAAIRYLTQNQLGRSTFLPLTKIRTSHVAENILVKCRQAPGFLGVAADLIHVYDERLQPVVDHLLGNLIFAADLNDAVALANLIQHRYRIITLAGEVISTSGAMSGGKDKRERHGILSQKQELTNLQLNVNQMAAQLAAKQTELQRLKHVQESDNQSDYQDQLNALNVTRQQAENQVKLLSDRVSSVKKQIAVHQAQWGLNQEGEDFATQLKRNQEETAQAEQKLATLKDQIATLKTQQAQRSQSVQQISAEYQDQRAVVTTKSVQEKQLEKEAAEQVAHVSTVAHEIEALQNRIDALTAEKSEMGASTHDHEATLKQLAEKEFQLKELLKQLNQDLGTANDKQATLERSNQLATETLNNEQLAAQKLDIACSRLSSQLDQRQNTLAETYHASFAFAKQHQVDLPLDQIREKLKLLKRGLDDLGEVNVSSIDEYDRVKSRYDFLTQQREDLSASKNNLLDTMNEMDQQVIGRFDTTFKLLNEQFQETFTKMFGGGQAKLVLTDPEHLLTTGIEIMAEPPGKRLQSMRLLSGGERALTAITLLFAVLRVQPAPFCVLDEAEAALDPANTGRFASYLNHFDDDTQFIVITHRKETMVQADRLYGITMQESGVSKLVSVDLDKVPTQR
ncbi:chromosome segregation protein SMC [Lactobacillus sp. LC28-10]|uniref:Chromosome partition protein Smc n=1 Tax=Secundilactobacillus angelensis TaxID=2722706 RepID=A0ABX1KXI3_9LACO|nr:chromosome segregation protein SMC [Secundilactobacillus angelensis]MCH5461469.1 chromosome segregation protein SMC [Secundilactobacillus angelensis]NLR17718.1 chromosome segregation protein SMC [Secundilactobacillus angelensis]